MAKAKRHGPVNPLDSYSLPGDEEILDFTLGTYTSEVELLVVVKVDDGKSQAALVKTLRKQGHEVWAVTRDAVIDPNTPRKPGRPKKS